MTISPIPGFARAAVARSERREVSVDGKLCVYWFYPAKNPTANRSLVFVHGYRGTHAGLEAIAGLLEDFDLYLPDLPGFGESEAFDDSHIAETYARWLPDFIQTVITKTNSRAKVGVVSHSFGTIATAIAAAGKSLGNLPLVFINPIASAERSKFEKAAKSVTMLLYRVAALLPEKLGTWLLRSAIVVRTMSVYLAKTRDSQMRRWIHKQHDEFFGDFANRQVALDGFWSGENTFMNAYAPDIANTSLFILGERDDITPLKFERVLESLMPNVTSTVIGGVGHLIHYETPQPAASAIRTFFDKVDA